MKKNQMELIKSQIELVKNKIELTIDEKSTDAKWFAELC